MSELQWFAFVILPAAIGVIAIAGVRVFEHLNPVPKTEPAAGGFSSSPFQRTNFDGAFSLRGKDFEILVRERSDLAPPHAEAMPKEAPSPPKRKAESS